ncbi:MAG TPA: MBL fold metallo-hydrolase [Anaerolineae bacterium]|nr:MBL fold metallo-hydrolase [Anaerolineae bacterium]
MSLRIRVFTSGLYLMTSGVVNGEDGVLLIDPGILPREINMIRWYIEQGEKPARFLVYTHHHWDHVLGGQAFPSARRLAHRCFPNAVAVHRPLDEIRRFDGEFYVAREPPFEFQPPHELVEDGWSGDLGDVAFTVIRLPGHAPDMIGVHIPLEKTLFAADMLSDVELPMIEGDGSDYLASLRKIDALVASGQVETLVPGHGHVTRGAEAIRARIAEDVAYIDQLRTVVGGKLAEGEEAVVAACRQIDYRGKDGWPPMGKVHEDNARVVHRAMKEQSRGSR